MNPLNWPAGPFLLLYLALVIGTLVLLLRWARRIGPTGIQLSLEGLDAIELAYLAGGALRAADTLLVGLFEAGTVYPYKGGQCLAGPPDAALPRWAKPYAFESELTGLKRRQLVRRLRNRAGALHRALAARGLVPDETAIRNFRIAATGLLALTVIFGLEKIIIGSARGHTVGFLAALDVLCLILGLAIIFRAAYSTPAGEAALARFKRADARALRAPVADELLTAFALTGAAVLAGKAYQGFFINAGSVGGSGCSGGGGGCGGGGGGCGGCS